MVSVISIPLVCLFAYAMYQVSKFRKSNTIYIELGFKRKRIKQAECKGYQDVPPKIKQKSKERSDP
jgi:hypothetical protein